MQDKLTAYWKDKLPTTTIHETKAEAMEEAAKARHLGATRTIIRLVSSFHSINFPSEWGG